MLRLTAIVKATFAFVDQEVARQIDALAIGLRDRHFDGNPRRSVYESFEVAPYVPGVGVTLVGTAYPEPGSVTSSMSVRLGVYDEDVPVLEKTLHVFGERNPDDPCVSLPLKPMPLVYEKAIGGRDNLAGTALYNLVLPAETSRAGCFAPVPLAWRALGGRGLDPQTLKTSPIQIPDGFDFGFFCTAPHDQRIPRLGGNEWILLDGMSPRSPRIQTRLPGARAQASFRTLLESGWGPLGEVPLSLDTLAIDAEDETISLLFRGHLAIDERALDVQVSAGIELPEAPLVWPHTVPATLGERSHPSGERARFAPSAHPAASRSREDERAAMHLPQPPAVVSRPLSESPPMMEGEGGIFETVVGTLDEILASMPALPFEAGPVSAASDHARESLAHSIPATPWDAGREVVASKMQLPPLEVEETMDVTAVQRLLAGNFDDQGTVTGSRDPSRFQPLPFKATGQVEPSRPPPLGVPKALPFEERPESSAARVAAAPAWAHPVAPTRTSEASVVAPPPMTMLGGMPSPPALVSKAPTQANPEPEAPMQRPTAQRSRASTLHSATPEASTSRPPPAVGVLPASSPRVATTPNEAASLPHVATLDLSAPTLSAPTLSAPKAGPTTDDASSSSRKRASSVPPSVKGDGSPSESVSEAASEDAQERSSAAPQSMMHLPDAGTKLRKEVQSRLVKDESLSDLSLVGANLSGLDLSGRNLSGLDFTGANLTRCVLKGTRFSRARLESAALSFVSAEEADFDAADLRRATLEGAKLAGARLSNADLSHASAPKASFEGATGRGARFVEANLEGADFSRAELVEADFTKAHAQRARFEGARLVDGTFNDLVADGSNFDRADLTRAKLERAVLRRAYLLGTTAVDASLENADLSGARASRAVFDRANLERATLEGTDLTGASLIKAILKGASGTGGRFDGARLDEADLRLSKLCEASFVGAKLVGVQGGRADLTKADLSKADVSNASFRNAKLVEVKLVGAVTDRADFRDANLARADLSGVDRESARFAGANLEGVSD